QAGYATKGRLLRDATVGRLHPPCERSPIPPTAPVAPPVHRRRAAAANPPCNRSQYHPNFPANQRRLMRAPAPQGGPNAKAITLRARAEPMGSARRTAPDMRERARAFRLARRHSLLVKMLRMMLPIGGVSLSLFYALTLSDSWQFGPG